MWLRVNTVLFLFFIVSCSDISQPDNSPRYQKNPPPPNTLPLQTEEKTLIFSVMAPDSWFLPIFFNNWNSLEKTKDNVHIFAHAPDKLSHVEGVKHQATEENLAQKMADVLAQSTATRLVIFISTHGARSGNWCFPNKYRCVLTEDSLIKALTLQAQKNQQHLKHVLIVPRSCHTKPIMDRLSAKINARAWPFEISYLTQQINEMNHNGSPADSLFHNLFLPQKQVNDSHIERFIALKNIDEFAALNNNLSYDILPGIKMDLKASSPLKLADFGFQLKLHISFDQSSPLPFPSGRSAEEVMNTVSLARKFYPSIKEFVFSFEDNPFYRFNIDGNMTTNIVDQRYAAEKYNDFKVLITN